MHKKYDAPVKREQPPVQPVVPEYVALLREQQTRSAKGKTSKPLKTRGMDK